MIRFVKVFITLTVLFGVGYFGFYPLFKKACSTPITFSIGAIDPRFGITKETVENYSDEAATVWNNTASTTLLKKVKSGGDVTITFIYDERQRTTIQNEKLKQAINEEKGELTNIKETLESLRQQYELLGSSVESKTEAYNERLRIYNNEVSSWNKRGGAPNQVYQRLQREQAALETDRISLNRDIDNYNRLADQIRTYGESHNEIVGTINQKINTLNRTALRDFEEGTYDPKTRTITIYEYGSITALKRVLIHEFGHSLSLNHVEDEEAIMYPINQGNNLELAKADKDELMRTCKETPIDKILAIRDDISRLAVSSWHDITAQAR